MWVIFAMSHLYFQECLFWIRCKTADLAQPLGCGSHLNRELLSKLSSGHFSLRLYHLPPVLPNLWEKAVSFLALNRLAARLLDFTLLHHISKGESLYQQKRCCYTLASTLISAPRRQTNYSSLCEAPCIRWQNQLMTWSFKNARSCAQVCAGTEEQTPLCCVNVPPRLLITSTRIHINKSGERGLAHNSYLCHSI